MSYQSEFTGDQIDTAVRRVTGMVTGTVQITAAINGQASVVIDHPAPDLTNPKMFAMARTTTAAVSVGLVDVVAAVMVTVQGKLQLLVHGDAVRAGETYTVDYLLIGG